MKIRGRWLGGLAAMWLLASVACAAPKQTDEAFLNDFVSIALEREHGGGNPGRLMKWKKPVRIGVIGESATYYFPLVEQFVDELAEVITHPLELRRGGGEKDLLVIFVPTLSADEIERFRPVYRPLFANDERYRDQIEHIRAGHFSAVCLTTVRANSRDGVISGAVIFIPTDKGVGVAWQCVVEEIAQSMGLPNDSDNNFYSIFNDRSPHVSLTPKDKRMLRLLYHPRLKTNMTEPEVRREAMEVLREWSRGVSP